MHELSLMENLLSRAEQALTDQQVRSVNTITVQAGPLANILPAAFQFAFEALTEHSLFAGAKLVVEKLPITAVCPTCGQIFSGDHIPERCAVCQSPGMRITGGSEVFLSSIDFEEGPDNEDRR